MNEVQDFYEHVFHIREPSVAELLVKHSECLTFPKGTYLLEPDDIQKDLYFIRNGKARGYLIDEEGKDITIRFAYRPGDVLIDGNGIVGIASLYWETLSSVEFIRVPMEVVKEALSESPELNSFARQMLWDLLRESSELQRALVTLHAKERYLWFRETYSDFPKGIPQKYVTTYLNMLPQTLSQVRTSLKSQPK